MLNKAGILFDHNGQQEQVSKQGLKEDSVIPNLNSDLDGGEEEHLNEIIDREKLVLFTATTLFPFDFFPDKVVIDLDRVTIRVHNFFSTEITKIYNTSQIEDVGVEKGPVSSILHLTTTDVSVPNTEIRHLKNKDAVEMRRILAGIIKAREENIDLNKIGRDTLHEKIISLGRIYDGS